LEWVDAKNYSLADNKAREFLIFMDYISDFTIAIFTGVFILMIALAFVYWVTQAFKFFLEDILDIKQNKKL